MKLSTRLLLSTTCLTAAFISAGPMAYANPVGGTVSGGKAVISSSGDTLTVQQKTSRAVIDWRGFDIGRNETTQFVQPSAKSIILNRVNSDHASDIEGRLSANGNVIVVNQNGVLFGPHSQINVNGLIATTADISNKNFMAGKLMFNKPGDPNAAIINAGTITANQAGLVGFVASNVINNGIITAKLGRIQLASGDTATVDLYGDKLMEVAVSDQVKSQLVANNGAVIADGGTVAMTAAAGAKIVNSLITNGGSLRALSVGMKNGEIIIGAEGANAVTGNRAANKGKKQGSSMALVGGTLDASGYAAGQQGGHIIITADKIGVMGGAILDASGDTGGGMIKVGGDFHGAGATATALNTYVDQNAYIFADANTSGRGGTVAIWSDGVTSFAGNIFARGGALSGDGGFVETSGHAMLDASGYVDLTAPNGEKGTYLLDPTDITVYGNFAPNYGTVIQGDTTTLASLLTLWLDSSDTANVNLTYNSMGATATGTGGTNTLTVSNAAGLTVGARIRLGASGSVTAASTVGVDTYTIQAISGTTVTLTTNLAATYTASAVYQGYISQLTDKSGNNYNATQATASDMPLWISNGQNGAGVTSFNGTNNFLILPNLDSTSLSTFVSFQEDTAPGGGFATIYGADGSGGFGVGIYPGTNVQDFTRTAIGDVRGNQSLTYPGTYLIQQSFDGNTVHFYLNGTSDGNPAYAVPINSGGAAYKIGGLPGLGGYYNKFNTDDIILYNNANQFIGTNSQALINQYQATKWNIALTGPGVIGSESGLTGAEAQSAMASTHAGATTDGFSTFTTTYLNHLSQTSNIILDASHNITLDLQGDTLAIASGKNLTLNAGNEIISVSAGTITTSQSGGVGGNITFNAANDIALNNSFTINSNGGAITFSSETNPVDYKGINLASGTVINSGGGNISLLGITTLAGTLNAGAGDIAITNTRLGHGNSGAIVVNSGANVAGHDILLYTSTGQYGGQIRLNSGAQLNATHSMTLQADDTLSTADGYNSASGYAGVVLNAGASIISPTLTVQTAGSPLDYNGAALTISGSTLFKVTGIGSPISLNANLSIGDLTLIDNYGLSGTGAITSTGAVTINSYTNNVDMGLGVNAGEMQISSALLNAISATSLTIGRSDNSGAVWLGSFNPQENLNILNGSGEIALNGATIIGAGTLSIVNTGALALLNSTLQGSALTVSGAVTDLAGTSLNATGSLNVNGSTSTSLLGNSFTTAGNAATVTGGTINLAGTQTFATAGGAISLTGPVTLFGDTVLDAGNNALTVNGAINSAPAFNGMIEGLLVGGGGGGGGYLGGGGGGGGVVAFNQAFNNFYITNVVIGAGGLGGYGSSGGHSENSTAFGAIAAGGGGGGHYADTNGLTGGSGGGAGASGGATPSGGASSGNSLGAGNSADATYIVAGANGSGLYGNAGGNITGGRGGNATTSSGGGGGAGAAGGDVASNGAGADGGIGLQSTINGASLYYAGGGGGSGYSANGGNGGLGGGGGASGNSIGSGGTGGLNAGGTSFGYGNHHGGDAGANTGGGGGGGAENNANWGGSGGSGVLVVRYATADAAGVLTTGASLTTSGADTIATFTGSGSFVAGGCTTGCGLTINAGTLHLNGALGDMASLGAVSLISANSLALPSITATHILARTTNANADLSISAGKTVTASNAGSAITLVAGRNFINNAGSGALSASNGRWLIYSANPTSTTGKKILPATLTAITARISLAATRV